MTIQSFYDRLAPRYHLIYPNWDASVARQGAALDTLIAEHFRDKPMVMDVSVGIGTQALGLAKRGYSVIGSDLSPVAAKRATIEAADRALTLPTYAADFQQLPLRDASVSVILCADNSLPHATSPEAIRDVLHEWHRCLRPGGGCLISMRDYGEPPAAGTVEMRPYGERTWDGWRYELRQIWTWAGPRYETSLEMRPLDDDAPIIPPIVATCLAINPDRVATLMREVGFRDVVRVDERFFQPVLIGHR
jgi:SAM-dependent methyltransferase